MSSYLPPMARRNQKNAASGALWSGLHKDGGDVLVKPSQSKNKLWFIIWHYTDAGRSQKLCLQYDAISEAAHPKVKEFVIGLAQKFASGKLDKSAMEQSKTEFLKSLTLTSKTGKITTTMKKPAAAPATSSSQVKQKGSPTAKSAPARPCKRVKRAAKPKHPEGDLEVGVDEAKCTDEALDHGCDGV